DELDGTPNGDRTDIITGVIEDRRRQTIQSQHVLVGRSRPAARSYLRHGASKSTRRADRLRRPSLQLDCKAALHESFRTERQCDFPVSARVEIDHGTRLYSEIY